MRIGVVTAQIPWGASEQFVYAEVEALADQGVEVFFVPLRPNLRRSTTDGQSFREQSVGLPLLELGYLVRMLQMLASMPITSLRILFGILFQSGGLRKAAKNLVVLPKAARLASGSELKGVAHLHAHWLSTPSTFAWALSKWTGIPFSVTGHRWDISERNMLDRKVADSEFVRVISEDGAKELLAELKSQVAKSGVFTLRMGVDRSLFEFTGPIQKETGDPLNILVPARLAEKKGHIYLVDAIAQIKQLRGGDVIACEFAGDGPLRAELEARVAKLGISDAVKFLGQLPHEELIEKYRRGHVDAVVLPSINAASGDKEGIPVGLMEAMAAAIPVVSTDTGGIAELVEGAGVLVEEKSVDQLVDAITGLMDDPRGRLALGRKGREVVRNGFTADAVAKELMERFLG